MSLERDAMYALFEREPGDLAAYGAMADLLDGDGWHELAHAFRWMHHRGKWPHLRMHYMTGPKLTITGRKVPKKYRFAWYAEADRNAADCLTLPPLLLRADQITFASHQQAVMWLAKRLAALKSVYDPLPPKRAEL